MHDPNLQLLEAAACLLEPLLDEVVLSGRLRVLGLTEDNREGAPTCRWGHGNSTIDIEDVITVVDGREELVVEVRNAPQDVRGCIQKEFGELLFVRRTSSTQCLDSSIPSGLSRNERRTACPLPARGR